VTVEVGPDLACLGYNPVDDVGVIHDDGEESHDVTCTDHSPHLCRFCHHCDYATEAVVTKADVYRAEAESRPDPDHLHVGAVTAKHLDHLDEVESVGAASYLNASNRQIRHHSPMQMDPSRNLSCRHLSLCQSLTTKTRLPASLVVAP